MKTYETSLVIELKLRVLAFDFPILCCKKTTYTNIHIVCSLYITCGVYVGIFSFFVPHFISKINLHVTLIPSVFYVHIGTAIPLLGFERWSLA